MNSDKLILQLCGKCVPQSQVFTVYQNAMQCHNCTKIFTGCEFPLLEVIGDQGFTCICAVCAANRNICQCCLNPVDGSKHKECVSFQVQGDSCSDQTLRLYEDGGYHEFVFKAGKLHME